MRLLRLPALFGSLALICATTYAQTASPAPIRQSPLEIKWANDRLAVRASAAPLADVIREVSRLTGLEVVGIEKLTIPVSADFTDLPLDQALRNLMTGVNYVVMEHPAPDGGSGRQLSLRVHSLAGAPAPPPPRPIVPIDVPALAALVASEADAATDPTDEEDEHDPDMDELNQQEQDEVIRLSAAGAFDAKADLASLIKLVNHSSNDRVRLAALKALGTRPIEAAVIAPLVQLLDDDSWEVRSAAVDVLGHGNDARSLEAVEKLLEKGDERDLQISALRIIALRADATSSPHLRAFLRIKDIDSDVREAAEQIVDELDHRSRVKRSGDR